MSILIDSIFYVWNLNADYGQRLLADIPDEKLTANPIAALAELPNHPAWTISHLNSYHPVIVAVLKGESFADPKDHPFSMTSKPVADARVYPAKQALIEAWSKGHADVAGALKSADPARLDSAPSLERWRPRFANNGIWLNYITCYHESTHLGQLSMWRRVMGLPSV